VPGLGPVLAEIGQSVALTDPTRTDCPDWRQLSDAELDELLARWGDRLEASGLLIRLRGCSATDADKLVETSSTRV
jgi:hypothetical protein